MKKMIISALFMIIFAFTVPAQAFYFDIGLGTGTGGTKIDGKDVYEAFRSIGVNVNQLSFHYGFRTGFKPANRIPVYLVGELEGLGNRIYDTWNYVQYNSFIAGGGLIFYPSPIFQLGASFGYSFTMNTSDIPGLIFDKGHGFGWNVSLAWDIGKNDHGILLGINYCNTINTLEETNAKMESSVFCLFMKYAYRKKAVKA